ncbi:hypothetical protein Sru01_40770 [Sphaerisporangium rufum]|uniref:ScoMcrA-like SRA domain-containing protein n=1 Tax=Sphaerisporangium rufum TaxID=1381558 RepID=A0A919V682_9ACTN|nr:hypothetical protein [Sphaerisporangium rufum]GII79095.1 hypothetical protein Sru01_40770 [Sphaerisporangium rufum]
MLLYSDPKVGELRGYYDGWLAEVDEHGRVFEYTGHGEGDQTFEGRHGTGNRATLHHVDDGRDLQVFKAVGVVPGTGTKRHRYVGRFALDQIQPYVMRQAPNSNHVMRRVIVFRLRPLGSEYQHVEDDVIPPATSTSAIVVPSSVTTSAIVEPETNKKTKSLRSAAPKTTAERREAKLADQFQSFMKAQGRDLKRFQITVKGLTGTLLTDLYDAQGHVLYELKGTCTREAVRMAIGQLLDYRRHVEPRYPGLAVLLPGEPHEDLRALLAELQISLAYWDGATFIDVPL